MSNKEIKHDNWLTDEEVEAEIEALSASPYVKLARKALRLKYKRRQKLYSLRDLEKRGKRLEAEGITIDSIDKLIRNEDLSLAEEGR